MTSRYTIVATAIAAIALLTATGCTGTPAGTPSLSGGASVSSSQHLTIGVAQIISHPSLDAIRTGFEGCMGKLGYTDVTYDEQNPQGDQAALSTIASNFASGHYDLVVAITTPVAQAMAQAIPNRPVVFAGVTDPVSAGLVDSFDAPGHNLTGTSDYPPIDDQIQLIKDIKPDTKTIGIVYSSSEANADAQLKLAEDAASQIGVQVQSAAVTNASEVQQAANSLKGVDAFYVGNDNTVVSAIAALVQVAEQLKIPVIAADPDSVAAGATAAYAINQTEMGCQTATVADEVLKGGNPATMPVVKMADLKDSLQLSINPSAAARQGVTIPDSVSSRPGVLVVGS